jgi:hypothetical protein
MKLDSPAITNHAWERFIARLEHLPGCPMAALRDLVVKAVEEDIGGGTVLRLMSNGLAPARYFVADGWRLVTTEDAKVLITVEKIIHKKRTKKRNVRTPKRFREVR